MKAGLISVVLPVHNQADHLAAVVAEYVAALNPLAKSYEVILVANNCRDNTWEVCQAMVAKYPGVRAVQSAAGGWGLAVKLGLGAAQGDLICYTNSARTSGEDLAQLITLATAQPDTVIKANRKIRESFGRRLGSLIYNLECRALFDLATWDINGTPKVFPRRFAKLMTLSRDDDLIDAEFAALCRREGYPVLEVPIFSTRRHGGKSTTGWRSALRMYVGAWKLRQQLDESGARAKT